MSDHALPDDLSQWPSDPHELLGVAHGVAPRELRRAYTRLIRRYKPEQHPEHFRRIREAYEDCLQRFRARVTETGQLQESDLDAVDAQVADLVDTSVEEAKSAPKPGAGALETDVYVSY